MPGIRTNAAAEVLGVSPNTLRSWERRYGFPTPKRTVGNHRNYDLIELQTLRDALAQTGNISSAVELARQRQASPVGDDSLLAAFESFDEAAADRAIEESLAVRPLERTVEELLLPAVDRLAADPGAAAELEFAARWATGWLHGARRLAPGGDPADRLQQGPRRRGGPHPGARPRPAPRRLPRPRPLQGARRRAPRAGPRRARPDRDRPLRSQRRDPRRGPPGPQDPRPRFRRPALRLPRRGPDRRRRPLGRRDPEPGHRHAER
ncbi:MAG: MerR family DNA-binding transcriptional regulator [Actinobacteria bacterium]|nr:MerR family DNA-binding transcriptional regulator [Actinomycetota bacterium]